MISKLPEEYNDAHGTYGLYVNGELVLSGNNFAELFEAEIELLARKIILAREQAS